MSVRFCYIPHSPFVWNIPSQETCQKCPPPFFPSLFVDLLRFLFFRCLVVVVVVEGERSVVMVAGAACGIVVIAEAIGDSVVSIGCGNRLSPHKQKFCTFVYNLKTNRTFYRLIGCKTHIVIRCYYDTFKPISTFSTFVINKLTSAEFEQSFPWWS